MVNYKNGDLLKDPAEAYVNTVNCVGVMGKGIALQFKEKFPNNFSYYKNVCDKKMLHPGDVINFYEKGKTILNVATKNHWKNNSKIEWVMQGIVNIIKEIKFYNIESIAMPALGCGNGGLDWNEVKLVMDIAFKDLNTNIIVYEPQDFWIKRQLELSRQEREQWPGWLKEVRNLNKDGSPK